MEHEHLEQSIATLRRSNGHGESEEPIALLLRRLVERVGMKHGLSPRETQVLECSAFGKNTKAVAADLHCSPKTVEEYWRRIYRRFRLASRQEIVATLLVESLATSTAKAGTEKVAKRRSEQR